MEDTEIRHASVNKLQAIARVLEEAHSWKKLMACIPSDLDDPNSKPKYNSYHISLIEIEGSKNNKLYAEILFEEWGTSGKKRPTLRNLLEILMNAELFRAADMVAVDLLNRPTVERPSTGIAAKVETSLTKLIRDQNINGQNTENFLDNMSYPESIQNMKTFNRNLDYDNRHENSNYPNKMLDIVKQFSNDSDDLNSRKTNSTDLQSDMIQFSKTENDFPYQIESDLLPRISMLMNNTQISSISEIHTKDRITTEIPNLETATTNSEMSSNVLSDAEFPVDEINSTNFMENNNSCIIPDFSMLQNTSTQNSIILPNLSALLNNPENESTINISKTITLNTGLPHFSYNELEKATHQFSVDILKETNPDDNDMNESTYLANGLFEKSAIVKKLKPLHLSGDEFDSLIFKQFKLEVEIMSKYNHENILALLGYSWDGPNYCLVYEYLDGGTLKQNLSNSNELPPYVRTKIAHGVACGIEYLHHSSVIHGDVKSSNILLTETKLPKLCDFALVRQLSNQNYNPNATKSTIYLPPEAFNGDISTKTDIYSFGVIILELLSGLPATNATHLNEKNIVECVQEFSSNEDFQTILDSTMKKWNFSENLYKLAKTCLFPENQRPLIQEVVKMLNDLL